MCSFFLFVGAVGQLLLLRDSFRPSPYNHEENHYFIAFPDILLLFYYIPAFLNPPRGGCAPPFTFSFFPPPSTQFPPPSLCVDDVSFFVSFLSVGNFVSF